MQNIDIIGRSIGVFYANSNLPRPADFLIRGASAFLISRKNPP